MFGQTFQLNDLAVIGLLIILEGVLSIDNALVLGLLAKRLDKKQQPKALTYGLIGAFVFRLIAIALAQYLLRWRIVKLLGGAYLVWVSLKHFFFSGKDEDHAADLAKPLRSSARDFWSTVLAIEITDMAFAVDSILAAIALVGPAPQGTAANAIHPKLWVVVTGGMIGVALMRVAAVLFIKLLEKFPRFEISAYLLVIVIGAKLLLDWGFNTPSHPHVMNFHSSDSLAFWAFWSLMIVCFAIGFVPKAESKKARVRTPDDGV
jgi:YkoY family integral membrane protein